MIHELDQFVRSLEPKGYDLFWHDGSAWVVRDIEGPLSGQVHGQEFLPPLSEREECELDLETASR